MNGVIHSKVINVGSQRKDNPDHQHGLGCKHGSWGAGRGSSSVRMDKVFFQSSNLVGVEQGILQMPEPGNVAFNLRSLALQQGS